MSQEILEIKLCPMCGRKPSVKPARGGEKTAIVCEHCDKKILGSNLYTAIFIWNNFVDNKERELAEYRAEEIASIKPITATQIIDEVRDAMCNDYCRYMHEGAPALTEEDNSYYEENGCLPQCDDCPLNRL